MELARFVAERRQHYALIAEADPEKYGYDGDEGDQLELHYQGCLAEMAFAKGMNRYWSGAGTHYYKDDDVGRVQVRSTPRERGRMIVRPKDLVRFANAPWVLVVGSCPTFRIAGWIWGYEARQERWLDDPVGRPYAYWVPQWALRPCRPR